MKRWFLAVAVLAAGAVGVAQAEYIIIIANLGLSKDPVPAEGRPTEGGIAPPAEGGAGTIRSSPLKPAGSGSGEFGLGQPAIGQPPPGQPPAGQPGVPAPAVPTESHLLVTAVVEVTKVGSGPQLFQQILGRPFLQVTHRWSAGGASLFLPTDNVKVFPWPAQTVAQRYEVKKAEMAKAGPATVDKLVELAEWCLGYGLVREVPDIMKKAADLDKDKKHPVVLAFQQVHEAVSRPVTKADGADAWREKPLINYTVTRSDHYALLHTAASDTSPEVKSRLARLEDAYRAFYYWFALKRKVLPVPDQRLVAVLATREVDFRNQHRIFDAPPHGTDGFFAPRHNLAVFSAVGLDAPHSALVNQSKELWSTYDQRAMLMGKAPLPKVGSAEEGKKVLEVYLDASNKALFLKALETDSERASVSHEGTRQLVAAAGLLPRTVAAPEWVQFGMGSFFEAAKGAPWGGVGVPSPTVNEDYNYLAQYRKMVRADPKLDKAALLDSVVTDRLFRQAAAKKEVVPLKARTTAWALTFFLTHKKLDGLLAYYKELSNLPRDLEFDDWVLLGCFTRAFNLMDAKGKPDPGKFRSFAAEWHEYINLTPLEAEDILKQVQKVQAEMRGGGTPPAVKP